MDEWLLGRVVSGRGEARCYLKHPYYLDWIFKHCGFEPFPGTLNVRLNSGQYEQLQTLPTHTIPSNQKLDLCAVDVMPVKLRAFLCYGILPKQTTHKYTLELIAPFHIRSITGLNDGEIVLLYPVGGLKK